MSWLFSQALVEEYSAGTSLDGGPSAQLNVTPTQHKFWRNDKMIDASDLSRFGLTLRLLTVAHGVELLMSYLAAFPAKTSALPATERGSTESGAGSGPTWCASFATYDRTSSSWRTRQCSLLGDLAEFSETWPSWGSMQSGECSEVTPLELPTSATEFGSLPTPRASVGKHGICWKRAKNGNHRSQIEDYLGCLSLRHGGQVVSGRTVNPEFQDWLMVWPTQWTALKPLETDRFRQWQQQHGGF
jgi:hypothetical protein